MNALIHSSSIRFPFHTDELYLRSILKRQVLIKYYFPESSFKLKSDLFRSFVINMLHNSEWKIVTFLNLIDVFFLSVKYFLSTAIDVVVVFLNINQVNCVTQQNKTSTHNHFFYILLENSFSPDISGRHVIVCYTTCEGQMRNMIC